MMVCGSCGPIPCSRMRRWAPIRCCIRSDKDARGVQRGVDGMCLDTNGNIIACAGWEEAGPGPMIYVFAPSGRVLETHPVPVDRPTNCTFGDADLGTLYVTSGGGHLFRVRDTGRRGWLLYPR